MWAPILCQEQVVCGVQETKQSVLVRASGEAESSWESQAVVRRRRFRGEYLDIEYLTDGGL